MSARTVYYLLGIFLLLTSSGCVVSVDLGREGFACNPGNSCEGELVCEAGRCVHPSAAPDAGAGDGGGDGGEDGGTTDGGCPSCATPTGFITLLARPPRLPADGLSIASVSSEVILTTNNLPVPDGTRFLAGVDQGGISLRGSAALPSLDLKSMGGVVAFDYEAGATPGTATLELHSLEGDASGSLQLALETVIPDAPAGVITLTPSVSVLPADGSSTLSFQSEPILSFTGSPVPDGTLITVNSALASITNADADPMPGLQLATSLAKIRVDLKAGLAAGKLTLTASSVEGTAWGDGSIPLGPLFSNSSLSVTPATALADGVQTMIIEARILDGNGNGVPAADAPVSLLEDLGGLDVLPNPSPGVYQWGWHSNLAGLGTLTLQQQGPLPFTLSASGQFMNVPPSVQVQDVVGRLPMDRVTLSASVSDPNPMDALVYTWSVVSGPANGILSDGSATGSNLGQITWTPGANPIIAQPILPGSYGLTLKVSDGTDTTLAAFIIDVVRFNAHSLPPITSTWEGIAVEPISGDLCLTDRNIGMALYSESSATWQQFDLRPLTGGLVRLPRPIWVTSSSGEVACLVGNARSTPTSLFRVRPDPALPGSFVQDTLVESREINALAEGFGGDTWLLMNNSINLLPWGATAVTSSFSFNASTTSFEELGISPSGVLFASDRSGGYFRSLLPPDPNSVRVTLSPFGDFVQRPSFVVGPTGLTEVWLSERKGSIWRLSDVDNPAALLQAYTVNPQGVLLQNIEPVTRSSSNGEAWEALNRDGLARFDPTADTWNVLRYGTIAGASPWAGCSNLNGIAIDEASVSTRGRRIFATCSQTLLTLVGDP